MDDILDQYSGLVKNIARSACYSSAAIDVADLCQVGYLAVLRAVKAYDPSCGTNIKSFVSKVVRREIYNEAASFLGVFTVDRRITHVASKAVKLHAEGRTDEEIATILSSAGMRNFDAEHVRDLRLAYDKRQAADLVHDDRADDARIEEQSIMDLLLSTVNGEVEEGVLRSRILGNVPAQELAVILNIPVKQVYEIEGNLKDRIKKAIEDSVE